MELALEIDVSVEIVWHLSFLFCRVPLDMNNLFIVCNSGFLSLCFLK